MKLGEVLIRRGLITEGELHEALNAQLIYGGHLGTCLIERELISEKELGEVLAESYGTPWASAEHFENIPRFVTDTINPTLAERHRAVPFDLDKKGLLHVAMLEPTNLRAVDELAFAASAAASTCRGV